MNKFREPVSKISRTLAKDPNTKLNGPHLANT